MPSLGIANVVESNSTTSKWLVSASALLDDVILIVLQHIYSKRHRKFAEDDANFANLDEVLSRVRRRTTEEAQAERSAWDDAEDDSDLDAPSEPDDGIEDDDDDDDDVSMTGQTDVRWNEWVEDDF